MKAADTVTRARRNAEAGKAAEDFAMSQLVDRGFRLIERNFQCRGGELDLIMMDKDELVFVEVRYRQGSDFGDGFDSVDQHKQRKLRIAAETWLSSNPATTFRGCRFDVVSVTGDTNAFTAEWIDDAF